MNEDITELKNMTALKTVFGNNYDKFVELVSNHQDEINNISTLPIDNYMNSIIVGEDKEKVNYIYKNIKYYFDSNNMYTSKISEGMAILVSKSIILSTNNKGGLRAYFARGNYTVNREIANPYEEISRVLLSSILDDSYVNFNTNNSLMSIRKLNKEDKAILETLNLAVTKNGLFNKFICYGCMKNYADICLDLEISPIDSSDVVSATTKENSEIVLTQLDRVVEMYHKKLGYEQMVSGYPTEAICNKLKSKFDDKVLFAKRSIGVYEKTKRLVKFNEC